MAAVAIPKKGEVRPPVGVAGFVRFNRFRAETESVKLYRFAVRISGRGARTIPAPVSPVPPLLPLPRPKVLLKRRFTEK